MKNALQHSGYVKKSIVINSSLTKNGLYKSIIKKKIIHN